MGTGESEGEGEIVKQDPRSLLHGKVMNLTVTTSFHMRFNLTSRWSKLAHVPSITSRQLAVRRSTYQSTLLDTSKF